MWVGIGCDDGDACRLRRKKFFKEERYDTVAEGFRGHNDTGRYGDACRNCDAYGDSYGYTGADADEYTDAYGYAADYAHRGGYLQGGN